MRTVVLSNRPSKIGPPGPADVLSPSFGPLGGVLVSSDSGPAAEQLREAVWVDPRDVEALAKGLRTALQMPAHERRGRTTRLRAIPERREATVR